jgi:hypothetical protein
MPTVETLTSEIARKVQDTSYTNDIILGLLQQLHLELAEGVIVPGERRKTPPLPELFKIANIYTSPSLPYVTLPTDYMRDLVFCANSSKQEVKRTDTFIEFATYYPNMNEIRIIERIAVKGRQLYYQGIERTTIVSNDPTSPVLQIPEVTFTASTKTITDTSGDFRFLGLEVGQLINVDGTVSNEGDKTIVTVATNGASCTVAETVVNETTFAALSVVTIYAGVRLTIHYYRTPETMTADNDTPEGIPSSLQYPLFVYGITSRIYDEIEDGVEGQKVNALFNEKKFNEAVFMLVKSIPDEGPSFFIGPDRR